MSAITTPTCIGKDPPGSGTLFDRITGFSNEKARTSDSPLPFENTPPRGRLETTVLDHDNVIHSPKRQHFFTEAASNVSFLDCAITPIKREKRSERSNNMSTTLSISRSEQSIANEWREVKDPVSGKSYYYNRLTRVSKWKLPQGAVLRQRSAKHKSNNTSATLSITRSDRSHDPTNAYSYSFATAVTDESSLSHLHNSLQLQQESGRKIPEVSSSQTASASDHSSPQSQRSGHSSPQTSSTHSSSPHSLGDKNIAFATTSDIKSPQDTTMTAQSQLFCLYCGRKCRSLSILESHLQQCSCFIKMQDPDLLSTQMEIERMMFSLWSKTGSNTLATDTSSVKGHLHSPFKETFASSSIHSQGPFQSPFKENERNEISQTFSSPKFNVRERSNRIDFCIDKKTCPFCEEALVGGDQFSSHLLKCKERKRRRNMRRTPKKDTVVAEEIPPRFRARTPGRRMPWE